MMLDNGMALMAAHLERDGYMPRIFDYNSLNTVETIAREGKERFLEGVIDGLSGHISETGAKMIGFKLYANGFSDSMRIAWELKRQFPHLMIIGGGPQVEWFTDAVFTYSQCMYLTDVFDALTYGDADMAITKLADLAHGKGSDLTGIPNLLYRDRASGDIRRTKRGYADMDELPFPLYDPEVYDTEGKLLIPVNEDSRSCDGGCVFCVHPRIGGKMRQRSIERLLEEIEHNRGEYGFKVFRLSGPKPSSDYINSLARQLPEDARFTAFGYSDHHYEEAVASGKIIGLFIGLESADRRILEAYRKTDDVDAYLKAARDMTALFKNHGLATVMSMIIPSPDETKESMERSLEFLMDIVPDFVPVLPIGPIPDTPITRAAQADPEKAGVKLDENYELTFIRYELDLLRAPQEWPRPPLQVRVDGRFRNPFEVTAQFVGGLMKNGIHMLSDEQVLMAYLYHGGLSKDQAERRKQCLWYNGLARKAIQEGDVAALRGLVEKVNENQVKGAAR